MVVRMRLIITLQYTACIVVITKAEQFL